jgi:hypothetical protein
MYYSKVVGYCGSASWIAGLHACDGDCTASGWNIRAVVGDT